MKALDCAATHLNNFRVIPRIVILWLLHTTYQLVEWTMHLQRPISGEDVALVGLFTGLFVASYKFYSDAAGDVKPTDRDHREDIPPAQ